MTSPYPVGPDDLAGVALTDSLLDRVGAGAPVAAEAGVDAAALELFTAWRAELDSHLNESSVAELGSPARSRRWVRAHRRAAAVTAVVVALAGSTGVAAAASGPTGPLGGLHQLFFGDAAASHQPDPLAVRADRLLERVAARLRAAETAGAITATAKNRSSQDLDAAQILLDRDPRAPGDLLDRLNQLRAELAGIPVVQPTPPAVPARGGGEGPSHGEDGSTPPGGHHDGAGGDSRSGDSGTGDNGSGDSGTGDNGSGDSGSGGNGSRDNGSGDNGSGDSSGGGDQGSRDQTSQESQDQGGTDGGQTSDSSGDQQSGGDSSTDSASSDGGGDGGSGGTVAAVDGSSGGDTTSGSGGDTASGSGGDSGP